MNRILEFLADRTNDPQAGKVSGEPRVATKGERSLNDLSAAEERRRSGKSLNKTLLAEVWHRWPFGVL